MKFKAEKHDIRKVNFLTKVASILFGIFLTSTIFTFSINFSNDYGLWIGLFLSSIIAFFLFKFSTQFPKLKYILYGSLGCIIAITLITFIGLSFLTSSLEGF